MKFIIERVSDFCNIEKPCNNAVLKRRKKTNYGGNYRNKWVIEINDVKDLLMIIKETDESLIISKNDYVFNDMPLIQIYDDYIE